MKKVLVLTLVFVLVLSSTVFGASLKLTTFEVSGSKVLIKGKVEGVEYGRANVVIEKKGSKIYIGQAECENDGSFDLSFDAPSNLSGGNCKAIIGATESVAQQVSFSYPGDKVYIYDEDVEKDKTQDGIMIDSVTNISRVSISGQVKERYSNDDKVMLMIRKVVSGEISEGDVDYIDQTSLDIDGKFRFNFSYIGDLSQSEVYLYADGRNISDSIEVAKVEYSYLTAEVEISRVLNKAILLAKFENMGMAEVPYAMILTMYDENNVMVGMKVEENFVKGEANKEDSIELVIPQETVRIKAMLWNSAEEMIAIAKPAVMNH